MDQFTGDTEGKRNGTNVSALCKGLRKEVAFLHPVLRDLVVSQPNGVFVI